MDDRRLGERRQIDPVTPEQMKALVKTGLIGPAQAENYLELMEFRRKSRDRRVARKETPQHHKQAIVRYRELNSRSE